MVIVRVVKMKLTTINKIIQTVGVNKDKLILFIGLADCNLRGVDCSLSTNWKLNNWNISS